MKDNKFVQKETVRKFKKHLGYNLSYGAFYACIIVITMALAFFLPETLILTVPLFVIPFLFGFQFSTSIDNNSVNDLGFSITRLFSLYPLYFKRAYFGAYSLIKGFFKSFAVFMIAFTLSTLICVYSTMYSDPEISLMISSIEEMEEIANVENIIFETLMNNETFANAIYLAMSISIFFALFMFMHHIGTRSIRIHLVLAAGQNISMNEAKLVHQAGFPSYRKSFYKDYYKTIWWFIPLTVVLYYSGMVGGYFLFDKNPIYMSVIALTLTLVVLSFLLPYYFSCIEVLFFKYQRFYIAASINESIKTLQNLKERNQLTKEEEDELSNYISSTKEMLDKMDQEEQKNSDNSES